MSIVSLGLVGSAVGSGQTLAVPITTPVPASDQVAARHVIVAAIGGLGAAATPGGQTPTVTDDAPIVFPNECHPANAYLFQGGTTISGGTPAVTFRVGLIVGLLYQPLGVTDTLTVDFGSAFSPSWSRASAFAYEGIDSVGTPFTNNNFLDWNGISLDPPVGLCYQSGSSSIPSGRSYVFGFNFQVQTAGVSSLTFNETMNVMDSFYDQAGSLHISGVIGDSAVSPGTWVTGGCTDVLPASGGRIAGNIQSIRAGAGVDPCPQNPSIFMSTGDVAGVPAAAGSWVDEPTISLIHDRNQRVGTDS